LNDAEWKGFAEQKLTIYLHDRKKTSPGCLF